MYMCICIWCANKGMGRQGVALKRKNCLQQKTDAPSETYTRDSLSAGLTSSNIRTTTMASLNSTFPTPSNVLAQTTLASARWFRSGCCLHMATARWQAARKMKCVFPVPVWGQDT